MSTFLPLSPRYRLDDEQPWLVGIDPLRRYWISVNGCEPMTVAIPGLHTDSVEVVREAVLGLRALSAGESLELPTALDGTLEILCIGENCFAIATTLHGAPVYHLFDQEALESLLRTAHPDWQCAPHHAELGRRMLSLAWERPVALKAA